MGEKVMPFHAPVDANGKLVKQRTLLMGGPGSGKTRAYLTIADLLQKSGSDAQMYVIDTDYAVEYMRQVGFPHLTNVHVAEVGEWDEYMEAVNNWQSKIEEGDWMVCDLLNYAWEQAQTDYVQRQYGMTLDEFFSDRKKKAKGKSSDEGMEGSEWQIIKGKYQGFANRFFFRHRGHVLACTGVKTLQRTGGWADTPATLSTFGHIGSKPEGEKRTGHHPHTVLYMKRTKVGRWEFDTAKDRERAMLTDVDLGDEESPGSFAKSYLMGVAKWSLR